MKKIAIILSIIISTTSIEAQTISLGPISKLIFCVGDTMTVPYQANGTFAADNTFIVQMSDANGSFTGFTDAGSNASISGSITVHLGTIGQGFRVRVASSDPYIISDDNGSNINVVGAPSPQPFVSMDSNLTNLTIWSNYENGLPILGMTGDMFQFNDQSSEPAGSTWLWKFDSTASPTSSTDASPMVEYATDGFKDGSLTVTNAAGCSSTVSFNYNVLSCTPQIPRNAVTVTATGTNGTNLFGVWVKAGGVYVQGDNHDQEVFVESGGEVNAGDVGSSNIYYLKPGSSFKAQDNDNFNAVVMANGTSNVIGQPSGYIDTFFCDNLTFDYSQVQAAVAEPPPSNITILQSGDHLFANDEGLPIEIRISNLLGAEVLSEQSSGALDIDLSVLPAGVYFAVVEAGNDRQVKKIAVVH